MEDVSSKRHLFWMVNGAKSPPRFSPKYFAEAMEYKPKPNDVIIDTYPKNGTTWMQCIVIHILRKGVLIQDPLEFHFASPFIDMVGLDGVHKMCRPGVLKTHMPFSASRYSTEAKYIYVVRNPFDTCISMYHHLNDRLGSENKSITFNEFFELFMAGDVAYGDYFDHLISWYPHLKNQNIFFTTYENMKKDTRSTVLQLARFLGNEYEDEIERNNSVMNNILHCCSFDYMKRNFSDLFNGTKMASRVLENPHVPEGLKYYVQANPNKQETMRDVCVLRKGLVGDWKNYISPNQEQRLRQKLHDKVKDCALLWPDI